VHTLISKIIKHTSLLALSQDSQACVRQLSLQHDLVIGADEIPDCLSHKLIVFLAGHEVEIVVQSFDSVFVLQDR
jgi:hypothetical protein